jgi:hypothetical protein
MLSSWKKFGHSHLKMTMASGVMLLLALFTAGVSLAPVASARTASAQVASAQAQAKQGPYYGGSYKELKDCNANLNEIKQSPEYAGGYCVYQNGVWVLKYYIYFYGCSAVSPGRASRPAAMVPAC